jgi:pimeloyl-ACP methyl ester carboxylesterase
MMSTAVVYVHGLWLNGWESVLLRRRLSRQLDCRALSFAYSSGAVDMGSNVRALSAFLARIDAQTVHLVGHSMGGLVILELFDLTAGQSLAPGRIVLLGSPVQGSQAARNLARLPFGNRLLGRSGREALPVSRERRWSGARDLGVIAGDVPVGFGRLAGPFRGPNDGTVLLAETRLPGAKQHLTLHTSHSAMVYSAAAARQTAAFLRDGRFAD